MCCLLWYLFSANSRQHQINPTIHWNTTSVPKRWQTKYVKCCLNVVEVVLASNLCGPPRLWPFLQCSSESVWRLCHRRACVSCVPLCCRSRLHPHPSCPFECLEGQSLWLEHSHLNIWNESIKQTYLWDIHIFIFIHNNNMLKKKKKKKKKRT